MFNYEAYEFEKIKTIQSNMHLITCLRPLQDGLCASSSRDSTIKIFNPLNNLNCDITLIGHDGYVFHIVQRENGNIISFSRDKSIKIWEIINVCIQ